MDARSSREPILLGVAGRCIYCGSMDGLTDEHIVPYGMGGFFVYRRASCRGCARITGRVEQRVLRGDFLEFRAKVGVPTRNPTRRPMEHDIELTMPDGSTKMVRVPTEDLPAVFTFLEFAPPGFLDARRKDEETIVTGRVTLLLDPDAGKRLNEKHGSTGRRGRTAYAPSDLLRLVGKAAYAFAVASLGRDAIVEAPIVDSILGRDEKIARWVGGAAAPPAPTAPGMFHRLQLMVLGDIAWVKVRLFESFGAPTYAAHAGYVKPGTQAPAEKLHVARDILPGGWVLSAEPARGIHVEVDSPHET